MQLNLPEYDVRLQRLADGSMRIYDDLRRKFVALTPDTTTTSPLRLNASPSYPSSLAVPVEKPPPCSHTMTGFFSLAPVCGVHMFKF